MTSSVDRRQIELHGMKRRASVRGAVLVLTGAKVPELRRASALAGSLGERCLLVAVDGGLHTCRRGGCRPDLFVGDADSSRAPVNGTPTVLFSRDKDFSDLAGALGELKSRKVQFAAIAGLLGGRVDHEWANLLELGRWSRHFAGFLAPTDRGTVLITSKGCTMATVRGRTVSLFALGGSSNVTLKGTRWELSRRRIESGSHGLSNETGTELDLTVHKGAVAVVFVPARKKRK